jgi:uncharacterized protein
MKNRGALSTMAAVCVISVMACITVNIYFPEATVKQAAEEIVKEIRQNDAEEIKQEVPQKITKRREGIPFSFVPTLFAQEETNVSTPAIRALKESMKSRFTDLQPYFEGGNIGETNKGLLEIRDETSLNLQAKAALRNLVKDENGDRMKLYAEVAKALNIEAGQIERIQKIFAEYWIKSAATGWWIQQADGIWIKKA